MIAPCWPHSARPLARPRCFGAAAQEPYYKGKRLTVLINFAAGGPTDIEGRLFAKHLAKHIDGQPNVIVAEYGRCRRGGGRAIRRRGRAQGRHGDGLFQPARPGSTSAIPERWRVDFKAYEFIAYQPGTTVHFVRTDVPPGLRTPTDIVKAQGLIAGGLSIDTSKDLRLRLGLDMLGVPFKYVTGYRSSPPARLALQRGEINMFSESPPSYRAVVIPSLVDKGQAIPVWWDDVHEGDNPEPQKQMEGLSVPTFPQLYRQVKGVKPSGQLWAAYKTLFEINSTLQRLIALPPGAPRAAYDALSRAISAEQRQGVRRRSHEGHPIRAGVSDRPRHERPGPRHAGGVAGDADLRQRLHAQRAEAVRGVAVRQSAPASLGRGR